MDYKDRAEYWNGCKNDIECSYNVSLQMADLIPDKDAVAGFKRLLTANKAGTLNLIDVIIHMEQKLMVIVRNDHYENGCNDNCKERCNEETAN